MLASASTAATRHSSKKLAPAGGSGLPAKIALISFSIFVVESLSGVGSIIPTALSRFDLVPDIISNCHTNVDAIYMFIIERKTISSEYG